MADGARTQAQVQELAKQLEELKADNGKQCLELKEMLAKLITPPDPPSSSSTSLRSQASGDPPDSVSPGTESAKSDRSGFNRALRATGDNPPFPGGLASTIGKVEFPRFNGTLFREWVYRCEQFFELDNTLPEMKVRLASIHLVGSKTITWHHNYMKARFDQYPTWSEYVIDMSARFPSEGIPAQAQMKYSYEEMSQSTKTIEVIGVLTKDDDDDDSLEIASCIQEDFEPPFVVDEPIAVDELPHQAALQVLDKMPRSFVSGELIFLNEIEKINEELVDGLNWKSPPMSLVKELDGGKVIGDGELRNTTPTTHALKLPTEFSEKESMMNGVVCMICFDPGGSILPIDTPNITSSFDPRGSQQGYVPPPLPKHPAGFVVDDQERALMASSKRIVTIVDPTNNLPMECTIRRFFTSSKGAECVLLCLVDMPVEIVKSTSDGWAAVTDEELDAILPTAAYALARIHMHLVHSGFYFTARGGFCYLEDSIMELAAEGETMERMPCEPTNVMWGALLAGCRAHKDYKLSEFVAWKLVEMEPENSAHYVVLSNLYAELGRWVDVSKVRGLMEERGLMKAFEINDLKYAPLLLVINDLKFPSELPAQNVRMVAYIGILCFDPGGEAMLSAFDDFDRCCIGIKLGNGAAELLAYDNDFVRVEVIGLNYKMSFGLTHSIQGLIFVRMVTVAAVHAHPEGKVLILVFDPGGKHVQSMSLVAMLVFESYILEDKDRFNRGVLLQEY